MSLDPLVLSRVQFAANITFHILFPTITIALAWILLFFKLSYNATQRKSWINAYVFWTKVFALCFALGVVSGITMSFQFGTNWPGFMKTVGNIAGPLLGYEVLTAFFLEATFLGIMLFGVNKVSNLVHTLATLLVAIGTTLSAFWILALNSWMHTPIGFVMENGKAQATDWLAIIFSPSMPYRFTHVLIASGLTAAFLVAGISAWRWLKGDRKSEVFTALRTGVFLAAILAPIQIVVGDLHGLNTLEHQPAKIAAMEALWETRTEAPLVLFGIPDEKTRSNHATIEIPGGASLILGHSKDAEIRGLNDFIGNHPPVAPVFFAFRIMVGIGLLMLFASWWGAIKMRRKSQPSKNLARLLVVMTFSGWVATIAGWYVTEIGRQPWLVHGVLAVVDAVSDVPASKVGLTLSIYLAVYLFLLTAFIRTIYYMAKRAVEEPSAIAESGKIDHAFEGERRAAIAGAE